MRFKSLRAELFFWVLVPLAVVALIGALFSFFEARKTAILIQERMLLGSARMIAEQTHYHDGVIEVQIPPASLELFQTENNLDHVYYRVSAQDNVPSFGLTTVIVRDLVPMGTGPRFMRLRVTK